jgi:hypothetical protein
MIEMKFLSKQKQFQTTMFYQIVASAVMRHSEDAGLDAVTQGPRGFDLDPSADVITTRRPTNVFEIKKSKKS